MKYIASRPLSASASAGRIAPSKLPTCGVPVGWIPVSTRLVTPTSYQVHTWREYLPVHRSGDPPEALRGEAGRGRARCGVGARGRLSLGPGAAARRDVRRRHAAADGVGL